MPRLFRALAPVTRALRRHDSVQSACASEYRLVARAHENIPVVQCAARSDHVPCFTDCRRRGFAPAPPGASLRQTSATFHGGGLPSGGHRTRKLDGASAMEAPL